jgi:hypothetical protein
MKDYLMASDVEPAGQVPVTTPPEQKLPAGQTAQPPAFEKKPLEQVVQSVIESLPAAEEDPRGQGVTTPAMQTLPAGQVALAPFSQMLPSGQAAQGPPAGPCVVPAHWHCAVDAASHALATVPAGHELQVPTLSASAQ